MRLHREGKLSRTTFYGDDSETVLNELSESIRLLDATCVRVDEMETRIAFLTDDGVQLLGCSYNESGEPEPRAESEKGFGLRSDLSGMDELSGAESLGHLNETYDHFEMELIPGLVYARYTAEQMLPPGDIRQSTEQMDEMTYFMAWMIRQLVVKKQRLLYKTDHSELLKACRQVIARYNNGAFSTDKIVFDDARSVSDIKQIPEIMSDLNPVYIWLEKKRAVVALIGGMDHAGVYAYVDTEDAVLHDDSMKLIDGLVYYDDGLREADDDYKDYLKSLEHDAVPYLDWKRKQMNLPIPKRQ